MKVILTDDVENLGFKDEVVTVKPGYGRNFLIPRGMAKLATTSAMKVHDENMRQRASKEAKIIEAAQSTADALDKATIKVGAKVGEKGKIFGSVTSIQLADAIEKLGHKVDRKFIKLRGEAIKSVGTYEADVKLHRDVATVVKFEVVPE